MSHRALVALARGDGRYDAYVAHDAGTNERLARLRLPDADLPPTLLDRPPLARGLTFDALLTDHLEPIEHEALLVVERDGAVVPFVVLPYVLGTAAGLIEWEHRGVVLSLASRDGGTIHPAFVRGWFQGTTEVLGQALDAGRLTRREAFAWLDDALGRLAGERHRLAVVP